MNRAYWITGGVVAAAALLWGLMMARTPEGALAPSPEPEPDDPEVVQQPPTPEPAPAPAKPATTPVPAQAQPEAPAPSAPSAAPEPEEPDHQTTPIPPPERSGPIEELRARFGSEPRSSSAPEAESKIEAAFRRPEFPAGLVKSVMCRSSVCKVETRWSRDRAVAFMGGFMRLVSDPDPEQTPPFDHDLGVEPMGDDSDGSKRIDVYLKRNEP